MDECALELGTEGQRFPDLVRVSRRMNRSGSVTVNGQTYSLTNDGVTGDEYFRQTLGKKDASCINVLGTPAYTDESSWYLKQE